MKRFQQLHRSNNKAFLLVIILCLVLLSCVTTTIPNRPYPGPYPAKLNILQQKNPLLFHEICKLPEIHDGISELESEALDKLEDLYNDNPQVFEKAFERMYQVGIPEVRQYCSPLQALFWLFEDGKIHDAKSILNDYSLENLLDKIWVFDEHFLNLSDENFGLVISGIKEKDDRDWYSNALHDVYRKEHAYKQMASDYRKKPQMFSIEAREILNNALIENSRWKDFNIVGDRLNAPELIDYYTKNAFNYVLYYGGKKTNSEVFFSKTANCQDGSEFILHFLRKAGVQAYPWHVKSIHTNGHMVAFFKENGQYFVIDNFNISEKRGITGPFNSLRDSGYESWQF